MSEREGDVEKISFIFTDEVIVLPYGGNELTGVGRVVNGGLQDTTAVLAWLAGQAGQGMIGNIAWDAVKLGLRSLRLRLSWGDEIDKRAYVSYIGQLVVAAKAQPAEITLVSCERQRDPKTFRVQIPPNVAQPSAISVDID